MNPSLPSLDLLKMQASWLEEARARILRKAEIANRRRILDLGSGPGVITPELNRRGGGMVIAFDLDLLSLQEIPEAFCICGDARHLPFHSQKFDLVFSQNVLLWLENPELAIQEVWRVLVAKGIWTLFEPDYGGMMEDPPELQTRDFWLEGLRKAGGHPMIGRKLPALLAREGFRVQVELLPHLEVPNIARFDFLLELPLTPESLVEVQKIKEKSEALNPADQVAHLPYFMILAEHA